MTWTTPPQPTTNYTIVPPPTNTSSTTTVAMSGGTPIGLLLALTQSSIIGVTSVVTSTWNTVLPPNTSWTNVPNPS